MTSSPLLERRSLGIALELLDDARVVVVNGPRQAGKSELLRMIQRARGGRYLTLDVAADLRLARTDASAFVDVPDRPLVIDEVQRGGDPLVLAIKAIVDASRDRGQFVLAGSTRFLTEPRLSESLAGRARFVDLWPLSQGEIEGRASADRFVDHAFEGVDALLSVARTDSTVLTRREVLGRVSVGGFPEAVLAGTARARRAFFADYVRTIAQRDIAELSRMTDRVELPQILRLVAARTAGELNVAELASVAGFGTSTLRRYLPLLEAVFLVSRLPAWSRNLTNKVVGRPKVHLVDSGLACHLVGLDDLASAPSQTPAAGALLETFVVNEVVKQLTWSDVNATPFHWRDRDGREADLVLEASDGRVVAIEVKAAIDVDRGDLRHLEFLSERLGPAFVGGVLLHCGNRPRRWAQNLVSLPVSSLWRT